MHEQERFRPFHKIPIWVRAACIFVAIIVFGCLSGCANRDGDKSGGSALHYEVWISCGAGPVEHFESSEIDDVKYWTTCMWIDLTNGDRYRVGYDEAVVRTWLD